MDLLVLLARQDSSKDLELLLRAGRGGDRAQL
jgi:hypothetical protein